MSRPSDDELVATVLPLARWIAYDAARRSGHDYQELKSEVYLAMAECLPRWDHESGTTFKTFASYRMHGAVADYMRSKDTVSRYDRRRGVTEPRYVVFSLDAHRDAGYDIPAPTDKGGDADPVSYMDFRDWLERTAPTWYDERMRWIMWMFFEQDRQMSEIAELLGVSGPRVTMLLNRVWDAAAAYGATLADAERAS